MPHPFNSSYHQTCTIIMPPYVQPGGIMEHGCMCGTLHIISSPSLHWQSGSRRRGVESVHCGTKSSSYTFTFLGVAAQGVGGNNPSLTMITSSRKANCAGHLWQLKPIEDALLCYVFKQHEQGITILVFDPCKEEFCVSICVGPFACVPYGHT